MVINMRSWPVLWFLNYVLMYSGKEPSDVGNQMTKVSLDDGTRVLLPGVSSVPTPFALQVIHPAVGHSRLKAIEADDVALLYLS